MNGISRTLASAMILLPAFAAAMDIKAKSAIIMDAKTGKVLWARDEHTPRYPASTTKIMTSLLLIEHSPLDEVIVAPKDVTKVRESSMHLKPGEKVTARDMLYAMMLRSANDGCYAVATHIAGSVPAFAQMMNERAKQIGCLNTHFNNPNGLNDKLHLTSAYDLALIGREAMKNPIFEEVVDTPKRVIARSINQKDTVMKTRNKWLLKDPSADGIKTGYTNPAGFCYVGSATRNGYRVITALLKSPQWQKDHQQMLDWAFKNYERQPLLDPSQPVAKASVAGGAIPIIDVVPVAPVDTILRKTTIARAPGHMAVEPQIDPNLVAPIARGQKVGHVVVRDAEGFEQSVDLVALEDVPAATVVQTAASNPTGTLLFGGTIVTGAIIMRRRATRRRRIYGRRPATR